jgi:hypothetical protein
MFIYLIVNHNTGKYYIGQHKGTNLRKYLQDKLSQAKHGQGGSSRLYRSMRKHPLPFIWSIHALRSDIQTREELNETERDFIGVLRSQDPEYGYNICRGGEGFTGSVSQETRLRCSASQLKRFKNNPLSSEAVKRLRELAASKRGMKRAAHIGERISKKLTGRVFSPETLKKMKEGQKRRFQQQPVSDETRCRMSVSASLRVKTTGFTDDHRKHISEGQSQRWAAARAAMPADN